MTLELPALKNVINDLIVQPAYEEKDIEDLRESIFIIIDDFVKKNVLEYKYYDFNERVFEHTYQIVELLHSQVLDIFQNIVISDFIKEGIYVYFTMLSVPRSMGQSSDISIYKQRDMVQHIQHLFQKEQPEQLTHEWFTYRWNHITASSAWQALDTAKNQNQLIYGKCKPINREKYSRINIKSATHHGQRYESLSVTFYEKLYNTKIGELGCLSHDMYEFMAASPDGINIKRNNVRYGRLLEIKNPVSREITGIPKKEYWVQMQIQMFVTGLKDCDFLETSFKEYESEEAFDADGSFTKTASQKPKGVIVCFHNGRKPVYKSPPWGISKEKYEIWYNDLLAHENQLTWIQNIYWRLDNYSCVTVPFNEAWMDAAIPHFKDIWNTIQKERVEGYDHRKPTKRVKKTPILSVTTPKLDTIPAKAVNISPVKSTIVLKIRTESFSSVQSNNN